MFRKLKTRLYNFFKRYKLLQKEFFKLGVEFKTVKDRLKVSEANYLNVKDKLAKILALYSDIIRRRDETIRRLREPIPDNVIGGRFENYKYYIAEPMIVKDYTTPQRVMENNVFVDQFAVFRAIDKIIEERKKEDGKKEE